MLSSLPHPLLAAVAPRAGLTPAKVGHAFRCIDPLGGKVAEVRIDGTVFWDSKWNQPRDGWVMPDGNTFFCYAGGALEMLDDGRILWEYKAESGSDVRSCQPLPTGRFLLIENGPCRLVEIDTFGEVSKQVLLTPPHPSIDVVEDRFRGVRRSPDGHYLICRKLEREIEELDADGKSLRRIPVAGDPQMALRLPNGNLLVALGEAHKLQELDGNQKVVWEVGEKDIAGNHLRLVSGFQRLANGNTIVCNYLGEEYSGKQPHVFEITRDKKLIWEFSDHVNFKTISQIEVLGAKGEVQKEKSLR
ncbi:MAG: hypothetical protein ABIZ81_11540 [Opitutaceae bacterium]